MLLDAATFFAALEYFSNSFVQKLIPLNEILENIRIVPRVVTFMLV